VTIEAVTWPIAVMWCAWCLLQCVRAWAKRGEGESESLEEIKQLEARLQRGLARIDETCDRAEGLEKDVSRELDGLRLAGMR